ncbi:MAG TPA: methyltransferase domain-containing protein [Roseiflexaceae bacterium]|nr:methyltransferase domain-containing protein [Roseiflexaceae bacterium]
MTHVQQNSAVQASYDRVAAEYARRIAGELAHKPLDRALLDRFAERMRGAGPVADLGCGPGHVTHYLAERGVEAFGLDLSPAMVAQAQALHPGLRFAVGDLAALDAPGGAWAGAVAYYSLIHLPRPAVAPALREIARALRPGGALLVAFHTGEEIRHLDEWWGQPVQLDFVFFTVEEMAAALRDAGFAVEETVVREPYPEVEAQTRRAYLLASTSANSAEAR